LAVKGLVVVWDTNALRLSWQQGCM